MSSTNASAFCYLATMSRKVASACSGNVWKFSECYCTYNLRSLVLARRSADNACSCCLKTSPSVDGFCGLATECITSTLPATKHNVSIDEQETHNLSFSVQWFRSICDVWKSGRTESERTRTRPAPPECSEFLREPAALIIEKQL